MEVGLLTIEQKGLIQGQLYAPNCKFCPIEDIDNNWVISTQEMEDCVVEEFMFVKDLPLITYKPKPSPWPPKT
jgi:hypothetical protein